MTKLKPIILVTNDDGINAKGLRKLIEVMRGIGRIVVVAPDTPQSGQSHAITVTKPLRISLVHKEDDYEEYSCNGTPADCVKLGQKIILRSAPDLVVSGINHGSNASVNILYSGTMAAVLEAAIENVPAIGFSLNDYSMNACFDGFEQHLRLIVLNVMKRGLPSGTCLNVNIPALNGKPVKGIRVVRQGRGFWDETYDERIDPLKRKYYWLTGVFKYQENGTNTDHWAISNNYISVVPAQIDLTAYTALKQMKTWNFEQEPTI